jgi:hypothetical protein
VDPAMRDFEAGRVSDGPTTMDRLREDLEARLE